MNTKRNKAFEEWWKKFIDSNEQVSPNDIWNAGCDWIKKQILLEIEKKIWDIRNDR